MYIQIIILLSVLLVGCGQDQQNNQEPNLSGNTIVWQGYASQYENSYFTTATETAVSCLSNIDPNIADQNARLPYIIITRELVDCSGMNRVACFSPNTNTVYLAEGYAFKYFPHEIIHWATHLGIEAHGSIYFTQCELLGPSD